MSAHGCIQQCPTCKQGCMICHPCLPTCSRVHIYKPLSYKDGSPTLREQIDNIFMPEGSYVSIRGYTTKRKKLMNLIATNYKSNIEILEAIHTMPSNRTNCLEFYIDGGEGCDPKEHADRNGRFFMRMECEEHLIEALGLNNSGIGARGETPSNTKLDTTNKEEEV